MHLHIKIGIFPIKCATYCTFAGVVKLVGTLDLGSSVERRESSSLSTGTSVHYLRVFM